MTTPACRGMDTEEFYDATKWGQCAVVCRKCPIVLECRLDFAEDAFAFAGGMTPTQRLNWARKNRALLKKRMGRRPAGPQSRRRVSEEDRQRIFEIFDTEVVGTKVISDRVGLSKSCVQRILRESGRRRTPEEELELARRGGRSGGQRRQSERHTEMVIQLCGEGRAPKEIADIIGITFSHVYLLRRRHIIKMFEDGFEPEVIAKTVNMSVAQVLRTKERHT
jgi:hypothetical protein